MAGQFEIAHSRDVVGAAIIAGGPYGCSESLFADVIPGPGTALLNLTKAINGCMLNALQAFGVPNPKLLAERARAARRARPHRPRRRREGRPHLSLLRHRTITPSCRAIVAAARSFYEALGVPDAQILYVSNIPAGHALRHRRPGPRVRLLRQALHRRLRLRPGRRAAGADLRPAQPALGRADRARSWSSTRARFTKDLANHGLSDEGIVYVPEACAADAGCRVHIAFHGCGQNRTFVGDAFARDSGFARWADTNNLIVLFPQTAATPLNPQGCWDWWGYTGRDYLTRNAPQIVAVRRMLERLAAPRAPS